MYAWQKLNNMLGLQILIDKDFQNPINERFIYFNDLDNKRLSKP